MKGSITTGNSGKSTYNMLMASAAVTALAVGLMSGGAWAQSSGDNPSAETMEVVVVTGTRIQRPNLQSYSAITTVDAKELEYQGVTELEAGLNQLPQFTSDANEHMSSGSDGTSNVNMRGLGSARNLVLIDGQRFLPALSVDLNFIPATLIERVDVLSGGASAVYGSDAISGVVNFIMDKHLDGMRLNAQYSIYQHTNDLGYVRDVMDAASYDTDKPDKFVMDGAKYNVDMAVGSDFANGRGNVTAYIGYRSIDPVRQDSRDYSACPLYHSSSTDFYCGGSSNNAYGRFMLLSGPNAGLDLANSKDGSKEWVTYDSSFNYNYSPDNYIQRQDRRVIGGAFANYQVYNWLEAYGSFMYMNDTSQSQEAPSAVWLGTAYDVNCDNPLMSDQQKTLACGSTTSTDDVSMLIGYRMANGAPRRNDMRHNDFRFMIGAHGIVNDNVSFDVNVVQSRMEYNNIYQNDVDNTDAVTKALQVVDVSGVATCKSVVDGTDSECVPLDVFSSEGPSDEAYDYIFVNSFTKNSTAMTQMSATMNANLGAYGFVSPWATDGLATVFGFERRVETKNNVVDEVTKNAGTYDVDGYVKSDEFFTELDLPLAQNKPFVKSLSLNFGYRYTFYTSHSESATSRQKTFTTFKVEGDYAPSDDIRFRVGFNRAVRAPNIDELFTSQSLGNVSAVDPCAGTNPSATLAQCLLTGVYGSEYGSITECPTDVCVQQYGGNPALKPETAKTLTLGLVLTPTAIENLVLSVDYYNIKVSHYIDTIDPTLIISQCIETGSDYYCSKFHRDHDAGGILFGSQGYIVSTNVNTGHLKTSGLDIGANYRFETATSGQFEFNLMGTYLINRITQPLPDSGSYDCKGLFGPVCGEPSPGWRHNFRVTWQIPESTAVLSLNWRYFGKVNLSSNTSNEYLAGTDYVRNAQIADYNYFDLAANVDIAEGITLKAGINNLFDKTPPAVDASLLYEWGNGNTYPGVYDPMGRMLFVGVTAKY